MSQCIYQHIRLRKGFNNIQNVHGVQTLRIPQLLLNEKKQTQARFEVFEFSRLLTLREIALGVIFNAIQHRLALHILCLWAALFINL